MKLNSEHKELHSMEDFVTATKHLLHTLTKHTRMVGIVQEVIHEVDYLASLLAFFQPSGRNNVLATSNRVEQLERADILFHHANSVVAFDAWGHVHNLG